MTDVTIKSKIRALRNGAPFTEMATSRLKTDDGVSASGKSHYGGMSRRSVWPPDTIPIGEAIKVKPIAADIYADNAAM